MKDYKEMLREAIEKLPEKTTNDTRLEVPRPQVTIQGNQTFITNFIEITNVIRRDPKHLSKFLFRELAKPGHIDGNRLILQGKVIGSLIEKKIDSYMKEFVICKECKKPDTHLVREERLTFLKCEACGAKQSVRNI